MSTLGGEAPDPKAFKSWEDAFKYPIPTTRRFQQQLKGDIASNRERLRSLVGGSYRDLLGTADAIILMDNQMKDVEVHLGSTSRRCNTDRLNRSFRNASKILGHQHNYDKDLYAITSQIAVLQACPNVIVRCVQRHGSVLLAAKVLVIARRLYRTLKDNKKADEFLEKIWSRLSGLRQKLLRMIDLRLTSPKTDEEGLIDALCAFALATSSASATDLLRHFHRVRLDALSSTARNSSGHEATTNNLQLWIRTLQDTRAIFQKPLAAALAKLKAEPLLKDGGVQAIGEFNLEIHEIWLSDDIRNFAPYLRHDDLAVSTAVQQLSEWAPSALKALLESLQQSLGAVEDFKEVVQIRQGCLELLFSHYHIAGVRKDMVLSGFRDAFGARLQQLVKRRCHGLMSVADTIENIVETSSSTTFGLPESLWSDQLVHMDTSEGVEGFIQAVHDTLHGFTDSIRTVTDEYEKWRAEIEEIDEVVTKMRNIKWEDHLDMDSDSDSDSEEPSESTTKNIKALLKEEDPSALQKALSSNLSTAFEDLTASIEKLTPSPDSAQAQAQAAFLLRIIREIRHHLPPHTSADTLSFAGTSRLYKILALPPVTSVIDDHKAGVQASLKRQTPPGYELWDGTPAQPNLPSPWTFHLLQDLEGALAEVGTDLWMPDAVTTLKDALAEHLIPVIEGAVMGAGSSAASKTGAKDAGAGHSEAHGTEGAQGAESTDNAAGANDVEGAEGDKAEAAAAEDQEADGADAGEGASQGAKKSEAKQAATATANGSKLSEASALQLLFDLSYLACMDPLAVSSPATSAGAGLGAGLGAGYGSDSHQLAPVRTTAGHLQRAALTQANVDRVVAGRISKAASEYRRRTALLFALANA